MFERLLGIALLCTMPIAVLAGDVDESPGAIIEQHQDQLQSRQRIEREKRRIKKREESADNDLDDAAEKPDGDEADAKKDTQ